MQAHVSQTPFMWPVMWEMADLMEGAQDHLKLDDQKQGGWGGIDVRHLTPRGICYYPNITCVVL